MIKNHENHEFLKIFRIFRKSQNFSKFQNFSTFCPLWGLPSRVPQHRTHLGLFVCVSVCTDFEGFLPNGIWIGFKRRCHSVFCQRCSKRVPEKSTFKDGWSSFPGHVFFVTFLDSCAIFGPRLGSPQRGRTALRVQSSFKRRGEA